jgi:cytoskeleton protein RodZ
MAGDRPTGDFGGKLRAARERRGVSLRQIANATKISVAVLEALERNDISRLPGGIFGRAFVRSYAIEVGLDPETTIQDFIAQFPSDSVTAGHPTTVQVEDHEAHESDRRMASTFVRLIAISVPIAAGVVYFTIAGRRSGNSEVAPSAAVEASAPPATPATTTRPGADTPPATPSAPETSAPPAAAPITPDGASAPTADDRLTVGLSVTRPCWVTATVDGQRTINRLLQPGETNTIEVGKELVLAAGDASAVTLTLNGAEAKPIGKTGEVVTLRLTPANFKGYLQNR